MVKINVTNFVTLSLLGRSRFHAWFSVALPGARFYQGRFMAEFNEYNRNCVEVMPKLNESLKLIGDDLLREMRKRDWVLLELGRVTEHYRKFGDLKERRAAVKIEEVLEKYGYLKEVPTVCRPAKCDALIKTLRKGRFKEFVALLNMSNKVSEIELINKNLKDLMKQRNRKDLSACCAAFPSVCKKLNVPFTKGARKINAIWTTEDRIAFEEAIDSVNADIEALLESELDARMDESY